MSGQGNLGGSTRTLATILATVGPDVERVLAAPTEGRFVELVRHRGLAELHFPIRSMGPRRRLSRVLASLALARWVWRNRASILAIHANGLRDLNLAAPAAIIARVPLVVLVHQWSVSPWSRGLGPVWRRALRRGRSVRWLAVSPLARRIAAESGVAADTEIEIVPNIIDPGDVLALDGQRESIPVVGYLSSPYRTKGFDLIPEVVDALSDVPHRFELFTSPAPGREQSTWEELHHLASGKLVVSGRVSDVRDAYARCDVVFVPTRHESFCRVVAEAMVNGIPVVASDIEPVRDLVGEDEAGILFPCGDTRAAARALRRLLMDPGLREVLGRAGRARARAYLPEAVIPRLRSAYGLDADPGDERGLGA